MYCVWCAYIPTPFTLRHCHTQSPHPTVRAIHLLAYMHAHRGSPVKNPLTHATRCITIISHTLSNKQWERPFRTCKYFVPPADTCIHSTVELYIPSQSKKLISFICEYGNQTSGCFNIVSKISDRVSDRLLYSFLLICLSVKNQWRVQKHGRG